MKDFLASLPLDEREALLACAVPRWFDAPVLGALLNNPQQAKSALERLASYPFVTQIAGEQRRYQLASAVRVQLLDILQTDRVADYIQWHIRAHAHFLARTAQADTEARPAYEAEAMHHMSKLFDLLLAHRRLAELAQALEIAQDTPPQQRDHQDQLIFYEAVLVGEQREYKTAEKLLQRLRDDPQTEDGLRARAANSQSIFYRRQGRFEAALEACRLSRALYVKLGDRLGEAKARMSAGYIYYNLAEYDKALTRFQESRRLFQALSASDMATRATNGLGLVYRDLGRWAQAIARFQECLDFWQQDNEAMCLHIYNNLGEIYHFLGQWQDAEVMYRRALEGSNIDEGDPLIVIEASINLGLLFQVQGRLAEAEGYYQQALRLAEGSNRKPRQALAHFRLGHLREQQGDLKGAYQGYRQAVEAIESMGNQVETESVKISLMGAWQQIYETMVLLCLKRGQAQQALRYAEQARARAFLDHLIKRVPTLSEAVDSPISTPAQLQAWLAEEAVLIAYFTTGVVERGDNIINNLPPEAAGLRDYLTCAARTLAFVVTRDAVEVRECPISPNRFRPAAAHLVGGRHFLEPPIPAYLYQTLIEPLEDVLEAAATAYIIPHGLLHHLPFAALQRADGVTLLREKGPRLVYAPSATVLLRTDYPRSTEEPAAPCLAIGYNGPGLQHSEAEARRIAQITGGEVWAGPQAKKERLYQEAGAYRWLHFSCHGRFDPAEPMESDLQIAQEEQERLTALDIWQHLRLQADLVTLSACGTARSQVRRGDELMGLIRAFLRAGARSVVCTLWRVHEIPTRLLMEQFYQDLVRQMDQGGALDKAGALQRAQVYLRTLTATGLTDLLADWGADISPAKLPKAAPITGRLSPSQAAHNAERPFADPYFWAPFILVGHAT